MAVGKGVLVFDSLSWFASSGFFLSQQPQNTTTNPSDSVATMSFLTWQHKCCVVLFSCVSGAAHLCSIFPPFFLIQEKVQ